MSQTWLRVPVVAPAAKEPGVFIHSCSGDERIYVFAEHGPPQCGLTPTAANFNAIVTYEDGCQKSTWRNFHENGHQHVCVCGQSVKHEGLPDLNARCLVTPAAKEPEEIAREIELAEEIIRDWACYVVLNDKVEEFPIAEYNELRKLIASALRAEREKAQERRDAAYREGLEDGLAKETSELVAQARETALEEAATIVCVICRDNVPRTIETKVGFYHNDVVLCDASEIWRAMRAEGK